MDKPNIVFIFTDDQRFDTLSTLGNTEIDTPNLDRLVSQGTIFTHAHIMGRTAGAVCMPSRAMMITGRTLFSLERQGQCIPPAHTAMPELFRANGYVTAHVGKWHQDRESHRRCFSTGAKIFGFKRKQGWYEACNGHWHIPVHDFDASADYNPNGGYNAPTIEPFSAPFETVKESSKHSAEVFTDAALEFIHQHRSTQNAAKPFFLYLAHIAPHDPRQYPKRLADRYTADRVTLPPNFATSPSRVCQTASRRLLCYHYLSKPPNWVKDSPYFITPDGVKNLLADKNNLPKLKKLRLKNLKLSDEQVSALQEVRADLEIVQ